MLCVTDDYNFILNLFLLIEKCILSVVRIYLSRVQIIRILQLVITIIDHNKCVRSTIQFFNLNYIWTNVKYILSHTRFVPVERAN